VFPFMHENNLDDLIINDIEPKNSKMKNLLTIIALMIVVLIVAIILTKIVLKEPQKSPVEVVDTHSQFISPKLTPKQPSTTKEVTPKESEEKIAPIEMDLPTQPEVATVAPQTITPTQKSQESISQAAKEAQAKKEAAKKRAQRLQALREAQREQRIAAQKRAQAKKEALAKQKAEAKKRALAEAKKRQLAQNRGNYYVQVGSFSQSPSSLFISVIQKNGFHYKITSPNAKGIKKLLIGPYQSRGEALQVLPRIKDRIQKQAFIVKR